MQKYSIASIILISLLVIRFVLNGFQFMNYFNLRILLFLLLYASSALGMIFSRRWSYLLSAGTAVSEFSISTVTTTGGVYDLGTLLLDTLIVSFAVWGLYHFQGRPSRRR